MRRCYLEVPTHQDPGFLGNCRTTSMPTIPLTAEGWLLSATRRPPLPLACARPRWYASRTR